MNIVLIGMSGAGKSTLGVLLAKAMGMEFVDTDIIVQKTEGRLLQDIINDDGIESFLHIEERIISSEKFSNCVIATGGSVVYSKKLMDMFKHDGHIIYLHVGYDEIVRRIKNITTRGIVMKRGKSLKDVYEERVPLYSKYSDKTVDCTNKDMDQCVNEILKECCS